MSALNKFYCFLFLISQRVWCLVFKVQAKPIRSSKAATRLLTMNTGNMGKAQFESTDMHASWCLRNTQFESTDMQVDMTYMHECDGLFYLILYKYIIYSMFLLYLKRQNDFKIGIERERMNCMHTCYPNQYPFPYLLACMLSTPKTVTYASCSSLSRSQIILEFKNATNSTMIAPVMDHIGYNDFYAAIRTD